MPSEEVMVSILIVDDECKLSSFLAMALEKLGYRVQVCLSVAEARKKILDSTFSLVLSDVIMPGESGFVLARWAAQYYPYLPIVLMTAHATESVMLRAVQLGVTEVLEKPFTLDQLQDVIKRVLPPLPLDPKANSAMLPRLPAYTANQLGRLA